MLKFVGGKGWEENEIGWRERDQKEDQWEGQKRWGMATRKMGDEFGRVLHERKRNVVLA